MEDVSPFKQRIGRPVSLWLSLVKQDSESKPTNMIEALSASIEVDDH
jgi:hypothetical protein